MMEWSKDKTMKLIELLQVNATLWNPSLCDSRRNKQKRREELRTIADVLEVYVADVTRKIQHLRTQYNRESVRDLRSKFETPDDRYVSSWYAYEYLHFLKDSSKPYRLLQTEDNSDVNGPTPQSDLNDCKNPNQSPPHKILRTDEKGFQNVTRIRDDLSVFGEYVANELRSVKGEKNLLVAKKKILDVIFEIKIGNTRTEQEFSQAHTNGGHNTNSILSDKTFTTPSISSSQIDPLTTLTTPTAGISEIIINSGCHYSNFKVDSQ